MKQIIYASRATRPMSVADLDDLMQSVRERNRQDGITGMLLVHNGSYMQLLEGDPLVIDEAYRRIALDNRHTNLTLHHVGETTERKCPDWAMGMTVTDDDSWRVAVDAVKIPHPPLSLDLIESPATARVLMDHYIRLIARGVGTPVGV